MDIPLGIIDRTLHSRLGERAYQVVEILTDAGFEAWWVGGCVRDMFMEEIPKDIDIATSALPSDIMKLFPKNDDIGARFGSIVVSHRGATFEVTTFRKDDSASDGRHPESVCFGSRERDAARRDFTVNAMYFDPISRILYDPYDGAKDLKERLIAFIGDPDIRVQHDALRILRAIRFRARIAGQYHPDTFAALLRNAQRTANLSGQRFVEEMEGMLLGPHPEIALEDLWETGVLRVILPELSLCKGIAQPANYHHEGDVWNHTLKCAASFTGDHDVDVRWAAIFHDVGKTKTFSLKERIRFDHHAEESAAIIHSVFARLQFPKQRIEKIAWIAGHHMMMGSLQSMSKERKAHWYYHPWFRELLQVMWLDIAGTIPADFTLYEEIIDDYNRFLDEYPRPPRALLSGNEIMEILGIGPGEAVGGAVAKLHAAQVRGEVKTKAEARQYLQRHPLKIVG